MHALLALIFLQIVSESFPVSSSGHLALALAYLKRSAPDLFASLSPLFSSDTFLFLLHIPTIVILIVYFRSIWWPLLYSINRCWRLVMKLIAYAFVADSVTVLLYPIVKLYIAPFFPLSLGFALTALLLFSLRWIQFTPFAPAACPAKLYAKPGSKGSVGAFLMLGFFQGLALLPGVSRLATVYTTARWLGMRPEKAFGVSWMLQFPLMVAAAGMAIIKEIYAPSIGMLGVALSDLSYEASYFALQATKDVLAKWEAWVEGLFIIILATITGYGVLWLADWLSRRNLLWIVGFYMLMPIIIFIFL